MNQLEYHKWKSSISEQAADLNEARGQVEAAQLNRWEAEAHRYMFMTFPFTRAPGEPAAERRRDEQESGAQSSQVANEAKSEGSLRKAAGRAIADFIFGTLPSWVREARRPHGRVLVLDVREPASILEERS